MMKLSTGQDSTLGSYLKLCLAVFGKDSEQVKFIMDKIAESPNGAHEEVVADESQMLYLLVNLKPQNTLDDML
jgi:hypothetical protein